MNNILNIGDKRYLVARTVKESTLSKEDALTFQKYLRVSSVFKKGPDYYFCDLIEDAIILGEELNEHTDQDEDVSDAESSEPEIGIG